MRKSRNSTRRYLTALLLTLIYLTITMTPLAPLALRSPHIAHALTGECAGDCDICGCSAEQRVNRTCCCQQKKNLAARHKTSPADCCKKKPGGTVAVVRCGSPCGSGKQPAMLNLAKSELIPFSYHAGLSTLPTTAEHYERPRRLSSRLGDPPEPPPHRTPIC